MRTEQELPVSFWERVEKTDTCWNWIGILGRGGYGQTPMQWKTRLAHRVAYEFLIGGIPDGLTLDHLCRNRKCVNPEHLEPVSMRENILRGKGVASLNAKKTQCKNGHVFDEKNTCYNVSRNARICRICQVMRMRNKRKLLSPEYAGKGKGAVNRLKTHCRKGHPYFGENLRIDNSGGRQCRTCIRENQRNIYKRLKFESC